MGRDVAYLEAVIGGNIPIITFSYEDFSSQFGVQTAGWFDLGYKDGAFPMLMQDFYLSAPLYFRYSDWSLAFKYNHISSHLGDGMDVLLEHSLSDDERETYKFYDDLAEEEDMNLTLQSPIVYSRDYISVHISYEYKIKSIEMRLYTHIGYVHKMIPDHLKRWFVGSGVEAMYPMTYIAPYYAHDLTRNQDLRSIDYSGQLGVIMFPERKSYFQVRFALTGFVGYDRRGQMLGKTLRRVGFGLFVR